MHLFNSFWKQIFKLIAYMDAQDLMQHCIVDFIQQSSLAVIHIIK